MVGLGELAHLMVASLTFEVGGWTVSHPMVDTSLKMRRPHLMVGLGLTSWWA